ncbi:hypothetical protein [Mycobacterium sp. URHB0044]|jgi:hypothetical protein|uniref:Rv0361 family membrane protein n=1 Tax=Mycobacterium sp. URHB0044 TaxID=1380386 RepID=UPI00048E27E5|nr:hypothetical protein [Mycobacterium sp. URHB0044]
MAGPYPYPEPFPQQPHPPQGGSQGPYPDQVPSPYPGSLPPPVPYPSRPRRRRLLVAGLAVLVAAALAAVAVTVVFATRSDDSATATLTPETAKTSIQAFLDALSRGDDETIARHASCGVFDEIKDKQSDMALANLASDAFRRQFGSAEVTSIDKIVTWSENQAQVLFTMQVKQAGRSQSESERQAIAQVLTQNGQILVCSYLPRTGQY